ncbi:MAG: FtsX-like permease family protein [Candidatus Acidiferrum sp.]
MDSRASVCYLAPGCDHSHSFDIAQRSLENLLGWCSRGSLVHDCEFLKSKRLHSCNEIGIRMALGARESGVLWMVLRESLVVLGIGVAVGVPATLAAARLVQSGLFGLSPFDPLTLCAAICVVSAVTLLAVYLPARKATKIDPLVALRYE